MKKDHKKNSDDPWHKNLVWIYTRAGFLTVMLLNIGLFSLFNFQKYVLTFMVHDAVPFNGTAPRSKFFVDAHLFENCTQHPNSSDVCKNITSAIRSAELHDTSEFRAIIYDFAVYSVFMSVSLWLLITVYRTSYEKTYFIALQHNSLVSYDLLENLTESRSEYLKSREENTSPDSHIFVTKEDYGLHMFMREDLVFGDSRKFYELRESLEEVMLKPYRRKPYFLFVHVIEWIHDLLRAVQMMHKKNVYHLNLQPKNVHLHWLQSAWKTECLAWANNENKSNCFKRMISSTLESDKYEYSEKRHVVLPNFDYAVRSNTGEVMASSIGVPVHYRPPECFNLELVDAAKVDAWCVGVIAYELLTGGLLSMRAKRFPPDTACEEIISDSLNKEFISTAMHARYHILNCFLEIRFIQKTFSSYDLDQTVFTTDCWTFLTGLLKSSPEERLSIQKALKHPLMSKIRPQNGKVYYINYPL